MFRGLHQRPLRPPLQGLSALSFLVHGGPAGAVGVRVLATAGFNDAGPSFTIPDVPAGAWRRIDIPLSALVTNPVDYELLTGRSFAVLGSGSRSTEGPTGSGDPALLIVNGVGRVDPDLSGTLAPIAGAWKDHSILLPQAIVPGQTVDVSWLAWTGANQASVSIEDVTLVPSPSSSSGPSSAGRHRGRRRVAASRFRTSSSFFAG